MSLLLVSQQSSVRKVELQTGKVCLTSMLIHVYRHMSRACDALCSLTHHLIILLSFS
jgi:hypothetical protein